MPRPAFVSCPQYSHGTINSPCPPCMAACPAPRLCPLFSTFQCMPTTSRSHQSPTWLRCLAPAPAGSHWHATPCGDSLALHAWQRRWAITAWVEVMRLNQQSMMLLPQLHTKLLDDRLHNFGGCGVPAIHFVQTRGALFVFRRLPPCESQPGTPRLPACNSALEGVGPRKDGACVCPTSSETVCFFVRGSSPWLSVNSTSDVNKMSIGDLALHSIDILLVPELKSTLDWRRSQPDSSPKHYCICPTSRSQRGGDIA